MPTSLRLVTGDAGGCGGMRDGDGPDCTPKLRHAGDAGQGMRDRGCGTDEIITQLN
jgi:hypothetical protein